MDSSLTRFHVPDEVVSVGQAACQPGRQVRSPDVSLMSLIGSDLSLSPGHLRCGDTKAVGDRVSL